MKLPNESDKQVLLQLEDISFRKDSISILNNINLSIYKGEIHSIVGDHGSGKTSLARIIAGINKPLRGTIRFDNQDYRHLNLKQARRLGIEIVFQNLCLLENLSVAENLFIVSPKTISLSSFNRKKHLRELASNVLYDFGIPIDPQLLVKELPLSQKIFVNIVCCLMKSPKLLILDTSLDKLIPADHKKMTYILKRLQKTGLSVIQITNRIEEAYNLTDKITILRNGEILLTDTIDKLDRLQLIKLCYSRLPDSSKNQNYDFHQLLRYNDAVLNKLPIPLMVSDSQGLLKMINDTGETYFSVTKDQLLNTPINELLKSENNEARELISQSIKDPKEKGFYNIRLQVAGNQAIVNIKIFPIFDGAFFIGTIIIIEDITRQESLRQQMILSEKLASVGLLAAGVAHEINNPLEIIKNYINFMNYNLKTQEMQETLKLVGEELDLIKHIIGNLITFSDQNRAEDGPFNVNELILSLLNLITFSARHQNIQIEYIPPESEILLNANKNEMKQVLLNLLKNSFEAMPEGGKVRILLSSEIIDERDVAVIKIQDNGPGLTGINPGDLFLPFYSTKKKNRSNLGLGLSISYNIVTKYKGTIAADNLISGGCEVTVVMPIT